MKKILKKLGALLALALCAAAVYVPCRSYAVSERGTSLYYGGEVLAPLIFLFIVIMIRYWNYGEEE